MNISNIAYYHRAEGASSGTTLSLRNLCLREDVELEHLFYATAEAIDAEDLLTRFRRLVYDTMEFSSETETTIMFKVHDVHGNTNCLNFKKRKEQ